MLPEKGGNDLAYCMRDFNCHLYLLFMSLRCFKSNVEQMQVELTCTVDLWFIVRQTRKAGTQRQTHTTSTADSTSALSQALL